MRTWFTPVWHLSRTGHVEAGLNLRGPSRKAKYSPATDSVPGSASERWEEPLPGEDSEPETTCLQAVGARLGGLQIADFRLQIGGPALQSQFCNLQSAIRRGVTACLLHNDPATYRR